MNIKCIFGFCTFKGCKKRGIYRMARELPKGEKSFRVCEKHMRELMERASSITAEVQIPVEISLGGHGDD